MKSYFTFFISLLFSILAMAQTNPIEKVEVELDPLIMDSYDYATGRMNDVDWMFKLTRDNGSRIGFEYKLSKSLSINFKSNYSFLSLFSGVTNDIGLRHYFGHANKIDRNQQGNNLNGSYVELGTRVSFGSSTSLTNQTFVALGLQSRFLKHGMIDTGVKLVYNDQGNSIRLISGFDLGLAFSPGYNLQQLEENKCAVVRCFDEQFYMFKTQISRLLDVSLSKRFIEFRIRPNIELEHRISKVGLSMNHEIVADFNFREFSNLPTIGYATAELAFRSGIRWYVGKKRRIIKGKTSNNLSGIYLGPIGDIGVLAGEYRNIKLKNGEFWSAGINIGYQTRLLKNLYIKLNAGMMYREYFNHDPLNIRIFEIDTNNITSGSFSNPLGRLVIDDHSELKLIGGLVVGYAF